MPGRRTASASAAFTLVETLIATVVCVVVASIAFFALSSASHDFASLSDEAAERDLRELRLWKTLESDLRSAAALGGVPFSGDSRSVSFVRLSRSGGADSQFVVESVAWAPAGTSGLERKSLLNPESRNAMDALPVKTTFESPSGAVSFRYASISTQTAVGGDASQSDIEWRDSWNPSLGIPAAVRILIGGRITDVAIAAGGGGDSGDASK